MKSWIIRYINEFGHSNWFTVRADSVREALNIGYETTFRWNCEIVGVIQSA